MNIYFFPVLHSFLSFFFLSLAFMKNALALANFLLCSAEGPLSPSLCLLKRMTLSYKHWPANYSTNAHQVCPGKCMTAHWQLFVGFKGVSERMNVHVCLDAHVMKLLPYVFVISVTIKLFNNERRCSWCSCTSEIYIDCDIRLS